MLRTLLKIALLILGVLLISAAGISVAVYGSADPCTVLAEERARRARGTAEAAMGSDDPGPTTSRDAVDEARDVLGRATGEVAEAGTEAAVEVEDMGTLACTGALWDTWF